MATIQDVRKQLEASLGNLSAARAQEIAKGMMDRDAAREQVARLAADLLEWSQRNRAKITAIVRDEVRDQLRQMGVATEEEVRALRKRVRDLERANRTGAVRSGSKRASAAKRSTSTTSTAAKRSTPAKRSTTAKAPGKGKGDSARATPPKE